MCMAFTRHNPSWTALFRTNCSIVLVMFTNPRRLGTSNQRCSVNVFIQSFSRRSRRGRLFAAARFAMSVRLYRVRSLSTRAIIATRPAMMVLGLGTGVAKQGGRQSPGECSRRREEAELFEAIRRFSIRLLTSAATLSVAVHRQADGGNFFWRAAGHRYSMAQSVF